MFPCGGCRGFSQPRPRWRRWAVPALRGPSRPRWRDGDVSLRCSCPFPVPYLPSWRPGVLCSRGVDSRHPGGIPPTPAAGPGRSSRHSTLGRSRTGGQGGFARLRRGGTPCWSKGVTPRLPLLREDMYLSLCVQVTRVAIRPLGTHGVNLQWGRRHIVTYMRLVSVKRRLHWEMGPWNQC